MKKQKHKAGTTQTGTTQIGRLSLLVGALIATGVLSPLSMPEAVAAPLPVPCGGCFNGATPIPNFVQAGVVTLSNPSSTNLTINQSSQTAILNWQSFDIAKNYSVNFVQHSSTSSALNRIWDPAGNPTRIAGSLTANGQVYLINQNGIIFANGAQVNVGALIASSLDIKDSVYENGYLVPDYSNNQINPAFSGSGGFVRVDTGAVLNGSKIMMFAPVVENNGSIVTADGQAVLAAGHKVYLEASQDPNLRGVLVEVDVTNAGAADTKLAGQVQNNAAGTVTNSGSVLSQRGNITLIGYAVNQKGLLSATTSVTENGTIKLLARHEVNTQLSNATLNTYMSQSGGGSSNFYDIRAQQTGTVTLATGSVTQVLPETSDKSTTTDGQGFKPSIVEVMGKTVVMQKGASIIAPGGRVNLVAAGSINTAVGPNETSGSNIYQEISPNLPYSSFLNPNFMPVAPPTPDGARVFLDNGSLIDVSGSTASVSVARNILAVQLRGSQLADDPLQKNGFLWGQTVAIDIRNGSTLANISGDEAQIGRNVAERTSAGGNVVIASTGDAILNKGSTINISGGQVNYTGANINSTKLISHGQVYDIATASPNLIYDGISGTYTQTSKKWGVTQTFTTMAGGDSRGRWDPGYVQGMAAGSLSVLAPNAAIESNIIARTVAGIYQRQPYVDLTAGGTLTPAYKDTWQMVAKGGTLNIGYGNAIYAKNSSTNQYNFVTSSDVRVQANSQQTSYAVGDALTSSTITLDAGLFSSGVNNLVVHTNGIAAVDAGTSLSLAPGGTVTLQGGEVDMLGSINVAGGSVNLNTVQTVDPRFNLAGAVNVGGNISTRGTWVNDYSLLGPTDFSKPIFSSGGNISIKSGGDANIASGVVLDASAGGWIDQSGKVHGGNGGNITLSGATLQEGSAFQRDPLTGKTSLSGTIKPALDQVAIRSYGVDTGKGGAFSLTTAQDLTVGGTSSGGGLVVPAQFFQEGGFTSYSLTGGANVTVAAGALIAPKARSLILNRDAALKVTGTDIYSLSNPDFLPDWERNPTSITLSQTANSGALTIAQGAEIRVDPRASITLNSANQLTVDGTLDAPAGKINLNLTVPSNSTYLGNQSIWLGPNSHLLAQGYFLQSQPNAKGLVQGQVLSGGSVNISNNGGFFVAQQGSVIDVSGTSANVDLPQLVGGRLVYNNTHIAGDAGSVAVKAVDGAIFDGTIKGGVEAGSQAAAGNFSLNLDGMQFGNTYDTSLPAVNSIFQNTTWNLGLQATGAGSFLNNNVGSNAAAGSSLASIEGKAYLDQHTLAGFDQVALKSYNTISLANGTNLSTRRSITLDAPVISTAGNAKLTSAQVTLGNLDPANQVSVAPVAGSGTLNVAAQLVDLTGKFAISGATDVSISSSGDIRLNGVLDKKIPVASLNAQSLQGELRTQGNVTLQAKQVYPSTLGQFTISVENAAGAPAGSITVQGNGGKSSPVLSAGGSLTLKAIDIVQNGILKAPLGTIDLAGTNVTLEPGSVTSVSMEGQTVPFGLIQGGNTWYYDLSGTGNSSYMVPFVAPPQKIVKLEGPNVTVAKGATVDLTGGGDLYANEFFAGTGGTVNVLDPAKAPANTFAIIPGLSGFAPYDPQSAGQYAQSGSKTTLQSGERVYLAGGNGLAAGYYTLLPASYALLPGAYRVTAVAGYTDLQPGQGTATMLDGSQIMAGKFAVAGTNIQDARYTGFMVTPGSVVRTQSEFHDSYANSFFALQAATSGSLAPRSPLDAGQLIIDATGTLKLAGAFNTKPGTGGKGAWIDLNSASGFDIVNVAGSGTAGGVELTTSALNALGAESLLIGGVRTQTSTGTSIKVGANNVVVDNSGATLTGGDIMLAANDTVTVKSGSSIAGKGAFTGQPQNISIGDANTSGDGALLRVSSGDQVTVTRSNVSGTLGTLNVENGATVTAQNSVLLDATHATNIGASAKLAGKAFSVAANNIDIGNGSSGATSLALTPALLAQMQNFQDIALHSYNDINFYGQADLGGTGANGNHLITNLTLNARSLNGIDNAGNSDIIDASSVTLMNNNGAVASAMPNGSGTLQINADKIVLDGGDKAIRGFDSVALNATQQIAGQGTGSLTVSSGNANVHTLALTGTITGTEKSNQSITASDYDVSVANGTVPAATTTDVGAAFALNGKSIADNGNINLPSGSVTLHATNGVTLGANSQTVASGMTKTIAGQTAYSPAGSVTMTSDNANVDIANGAIVDVSGAKNSDATDGGDAGTLSINATQGTASIAGDLRGSAVAGHKQGSFVLDAKSLGGTLTALNNRLMSGGFNQSIDMRVRSGDLAMDAGSTVTAHSYHLAADTGSIDIAGKIDASGSSGGDILLAALNNVTLESSAQLDAHASGAGQTGGKVALETSNGAVNLMTGSNIDVSGSKSGSILLRAPQINGGTDVAVNTLAGTSITTSVGANVTVEGYKNYVATTIDGSTVKTATTYFIDAQSFANNAAAIKSRLGMSGSFMHVLPGIQISSTGDLTLSSTLDLSTWRFNDGNGNITEPGILTLKAVGNLNFGSVTSDSAGNVTGITTAALSDGFAGADFNTAAAFTLLSTPSWSYRLVAGADTAAANVMAVNAAGSGNVVLAPGGYTPAQYGGRGGTVLISPASLNLEAVRTGTGSIDVAAGGGLYLGNSNSMIYTAGQQTSGIPTTVASTTNGAFTTGGGDINIAVKGDISAVGMPNSNGAVVFPDFTNFNTTNKSTYAWSAVNQLITDWLYRQGDGTSAKPTAWWINFGTFMQNIGALGGGNVNISAGGNITSLSVVAPTTGYVDPVTGNLQVLGGGNLNVKAGGNIDSGIFYVGNGQGKITAGGALGASRYDANQTLYTILALGQGSFDVRSGGDLTLQTVLNPTMIFKGPSQPGSVKTFFSTYGDASSVSLESLNGNVSLSNDSSFLTNTQYTTATAPYIYTGTYSASFDQGAMLLYPGSLNVTALNGSIDTNTSQNAYLMMLAPSPVGSMELLAGGDINLSKQLVMSDAASYLMQPASPVSAYTGSIDQILQNGHGSASPGSQLPLHSGDTVPVVIAAAGNVNGDNTTIATNLILPKSAQIQAGQDIKNLSASVQNVNSSDTTSFIAGRDVVYTPNPIDPSLSTKGITIYGPGQVVLQAGHNVDLGQSDGVITMGNLANTLLPEQGASVTVLAGVGQGVTATQAFIDKYINPASAGTTYGSNLIAYVGNYGAPKNQTAAQAFAYFGTLSKPLQDAFVNQVFFSELKQAGRNAVNTKNYQSGYDAIATLFPAGGYQGDINLYYSQIKTLRGGNINMLTPGGGVNAGLANPSSSGPQKTAAQLGVVTVKGGDVNAFVNNDFLVNQSRVFTLQGGNILMWSSYGNLDAGKGSKTVSSTPPPLLVVDPRTGTFYVDVTQSVVGSGIRVLLANANVVPGTVDLYAPAGVINAGDAGIGSAGNIYLGAQQVIGASNINFGGVAAGVPVAAPAPVSVGLGNLQDASKAADQTTQSIGNMKDMANMSDFMPTFLSVEVIGLGSQNCGDDDQSAACKKGHQSDDKDL